MAQNSMVNTTFPVHLPDMPELRFSKSEFETFIKTSLRPANANDGAAKAVELPIHVKQSADVTKDIDNVEGPGTPTPQPGSRFMDGLLADKKATPNFDARDGKMLTENADVAHRTSGEVLVDLFYELEAVVSGSRLSELLGKAWQSDSDATLKIIWNARSIHLGKSDRMTFYRAVGWLAEKHPVTLLTNLPWLVRPLVQKKAPKPERKKDDAAPRNDTGDVELIDEKDADSDFEIIDEQDESDGRQPAKKPRLDNDAALTEFDVRYGVAHGYWKDLLNILALAANGELKAGGDPRGVLNVARPDKKVKPFQKDWTKGKKKLRTITRHQDAVKKLAEEPFYKALHLTVARLFADQLRIDYARLQSTDKAETKQITLAAKWAPSHNGMHDQHTFIVSSIAELLYPFDSVCPEAEPGDRTLYLKHAREAYQVKCLSPLRKALEIVERSITANQFEDIHYNRVPSVAMKQYTALFAKKDFDRFDQYIDKVASGQAKISGATLLPSTLVKAVSNRHTSGKTPKGADALVQKKLRELQDKTLNAQWNTLVQRIKDNGTLESSIAVCDVSGSMSSPKFPDGTCPMDSSIGLSLLIAEITKPPFGGAFITFSDNPRVKRVGGPDDKSSFAEKVQFAHSDAGYSTDFVAVFERLILPMARAHRLAPEDMVKQVFVFSDMQFNQAVPHGCDWSTSYERIAEKFKAAGYVMPKLIFWNLAGGRAGYHQQPTGGDETAPKPVTASEEGTVLVSGYSQGQLKMFLENGQFVKPEEEVTEQDGEDGDEVIVKKVKPKEDPLTVVKRAIGHDAYRMLKVVD
ncbi:hypothetical protein LTR91_019148 [Friedmanniomyces endolithicus]|uniref:DUF2828 domain-containing protein n=1 Tax=Friedmanniomyces endolithicus TaxID=329885 RepID=A0AAN6K2E7_9PEZI|nr:hypothetical protein LTR38_005428 [Friedmanniomyces endolithicus]KAK0963114.1 hypothetical protein LTR91_019148 [Friedmanniomyces endolithicus]